MKKSFLISSMLLLAFSLRFAHAESFTIVPKVFDERALPRDIIKEKLTVTNADARIATLYPFVYNIEDTAGKQAFVDPSLADKSVSLANWIDFSRGMVRLNPGESKTIEFTIHVNLWARPGHYHAMLAYAPGDSRAAAEGGVSEDNSALVNVEVVEDIKENMELRGFSTERTLMAKLPAVFHYSVENTGNRPESPQGEVRIYDRRGAEVGSVPLNATGSAVAPGETKDFSVTWDGAGASLGQYKAFLDIAYGASGKLQDTTFFWIISWQKMALFAIVAITIAIGGAFWLHRRYERWHFARLRRMRVQHNQVLDLRHPHDTFDTPPRP